MKMSLGQLRVPFLSRRGEPNSMDELMGLREKVTPRLGHRIKRLKELLLPEVQSVEETLTETRKRYFGNKPLDPTAADFDVAKLEALEAESADLLSEEVEIEINPIELPPECEGISAKALEHLAAFVVVKGVDKDPDPVKIIRKPKLVPPPEDKEVPDAAECASAQS